jgi:serine/threonine-protein kinase
MVVPPPSDPEEVTRAAANPANVLGKYVLVAQLGKGAMGVVHKAWDRGLRRWVAIKILLATNDPDLVLRFRREAETAASIQHPNIVPIYDVGEEGGRPYLVMKFVDGSMLAGMSLSLEQAVSVTLQAAKGVAHAHEREVVHRDMKPANIMIDGSGHVYVMDFGLAKDLYNNAALTRPGTIMGTPSYMAPEQAGGNTDQVDRASDVYALGAILYELVTGKPPFESDRVMETIRKVIEDPVVPPSKLRRDTPPALEAVIMKALSKDKKQRYPDAGALAKALEPIAGPGTSRRDTPATAVVASAPARKSAAKILFWAAILIVLSVLSGLGVLFLLKGGNPVVPK